MANTVAARGIYEAASYTNEDRVIWVLFESVVLSA